eukprot:scaffold77322_cov58-Phaeocystis_antarctica.AAC.3
MQPGLLSAISFTRYATTSLMSGARSSLPRPSVVANCERRGTEVRSLDGWGTCGARARACTPAAGSCS